MLLAELRLNATHRKLLHPEKETSDTGVAANYGFNHFGRFAAVYRRQLPGREAHRKEYDIAIENDGVAPV